MSSSLAAPSELDVSISYRPDPWQARTHLAMEKKRFTICVCHRRRGKTELAIMALLDAALACEKKMGRYAYVCPQLNEAKDVVWDRLKEKVFQLPEEFIEKNESDLWIKFRHNGARIRLYGADNPDSLRGRYLDGVVLDEMAQMHPSAWGQVIRPMLGDRKGWALFIGTPKGINAFYHLYNKAKNNPKWYVRVYRVTDEPVPHLSADEIAEIRADLTDEEWRQEMLCDFSASAHNILIPIDWVEAAALRPILRESELFGYPRIMGVDVARFGHHESAIARRWGPLLYPVDAVQGLDSTTLANRVHAVAQAWKPDAIFVDSGQGQGVIDRLRLLGRQDVIEIKFGGTAPDKHYVNMRTYMWSMMAKWIKTSAAFMEDLDGLPHLKSEWSEITYSIPNDQIVLEKKEGDPEINKTRNRPLKHPDRADSVALTFAQPVIPKEKRHYEEMSAAGYGPQPSGSMKDWRPGWQR